MDTRFTRLSPAAGLAAALMLMTAGPALAQETRAGIIESAQADKQRVLAPPQPNRGELIVNRLERWGLFAGTPRGLYPWMGSVYPGAGFTIGVGHRQTFADDGAIRTLGAYSLSQSTRVETEVALPTFARRRARVSISGQYIDATDVKFYGVGNDSQKADLAYFGLTPKRAGTRLDVTPTARLSLGGGVSYISIDPGKSRTAPSIADRSDLGSTPGLELDSIAYLSSSVQAAFDWRRPLGYSGSGGAYRLQFDDHRARQDSAYSFRSLEAEAQQLFPLLRANWVIAIRGLATLTDGSESSQVPFFLLPSLGGGRTLRGYPDFRFRDRNRMLMSAELRWTPARFLDMAIFYDTGKVAARRSDLDFNALHDSYGIGARIATPKGYAVGLEVARSREHAVRVLFKAGGGF
jgi:hypothetical protein